MPARAAPKKGDTKRKRASRGRRTRPTPSPREGWSIGPDFEDDAIPASTARTIAPGSKRCSRRRADPRPFDVVVMAGSGSCAINGTGAAALAPLRGRGPPRLLPGRSRGGPLGCDGPVHRGRARVLDREYRESVAGTCDALKRKAKAGHVDGGRAFGYDNLRVDSHVERRINEPEAAVVRQIFRRMRRADAQGDRRRPGRVGAPTPARSGGWERAPRGPSSAFAKSCGRSLPGVVDSTGATRPSASTSRSCASSRGALARRPARPTSSARSTSARPAGGSSASLEHHRVQYFLTGLLTCGATTSDGTPVGLGRSPSSQRSHGSHRRLYQCLSSVRGRRRGPRCTNTLAIPLPLADQAILSCIESTLLRPEVVRAAIDDAIQRLRPDVIASKRSAIRERNQANPAAGRIACSSGGWSHRLAMFSSRRLTHRRRRHAGGERSHAPRLRYGGPTPGDRREGFVLTISEWCI